MYIKQLVTWPIDTYEREGNVELLVRKIFKSVWPSKGNKYWKSKEEKEKVRL